jgi:hypothetical protein
MRYTMAEIRSVDWKVQHVGWHGGVPPGAIHINGNGWTAELSLTKIYLGSAANYFNSVMAAIHQ